MEVSIWEQSQGETRGGIDEASPACNSRLQCVLNKIIRQQNYMLQRRSLR